MFDSIDKDPNKFRMYRSDWRAARPYAEKVVLEINKTYQLSDKEEEFVGEFIHFFIKNKTKPPTQLDLILPVLKKKLLPVKTVMYEVTKLRGKWSLTGKTVEFSANDFRSMTIWYDNINGTEVTIWSLFKQGHGYIESKV